MMDGDTTDLSTAASARGPLIGAVAFLLAVLVGGYLVTDKDMDGVPGFLADEAPLETAALTSADVEDVCAQPPLLAVSGGTSGRIVVEPASDDNGLTLTEVESVLAARGYDVALRPTPEGPIGTRPGAIVEGGFGGDTMVVFTESGLVLVRPGDSTITAAVACVPRRGPSTDG